MISLFLRGWSFIPGPFRIYVILGAAAALLVALGVLGYKIRSGGYNACVAKYEAAEKQVKDQAREEIIKLEERYDRIRGELSHVQSKNSCVGDRVRHVLDRL